jgi:hypothetical protein
MTRSGKVLMLAAGLAVAVALPAVASAQTGRAVTINLAAANSGGDPASGVNGTAILTDIGGGRTRVDIRVTVGPGGSASMPNHIHTGRCPGVAAVTYPLNAVTNGVGTTEVAAPLADLLSGTYAINLHRSPTESGVYVSCGNVVAGASALPATGSPVGGAVPALAAIGAAVVGLAGIALRRR